ncbi:hypothetical protein AeMF1_014940 [Aphanomyces euteiches]|nr:hypothetical protein AeMF1_014940 [Aphanomyces euteiches]
MDLYRAMAVPNAKRFCLEQNVPRQTFIGWLKKYDAYTSRSIPRRALTLGGQGRSESIPFGPDLLTFMKDTQRDEHILTSAHMANWIKCHHDEWLERYMSTKHGFSQRVACVSRKRQEELEVIKRSFAKDFWTKYYDYKPDEILNVDETGVYYDMPPRRIWAEVGGSSKVDKSEKHSDRLTAVLTIRADGKKLPILFIVNGKPGGNIETFEVPSYLQSTSMRSKKKLGWTIGCGKFILADNLASHVSNASAETICFDLCASLEPLPPNSTSACQPLDVGVMGPLKARMRSLWLREKPVTSAAEKRLAMIQRTIKAWDSLSEDVVMKSFFKAIPQVFEF